MSCPRVSGTLGRCVEYLSALSAFLWLSEGCKPSVTRVEWLRHSCLLRVMCPLHFGRGWHVRGVPPLAVSEGRETLVRCVEYLSALSAFLWLSEGCKPSDTRMEWLHHSCLQWACPLRGAALSLCLAGVACPCGVRLPPAGGVSARWRGMVWRGLRGFGVWQAVCVPAVGACRCGVSPLGAERVTHRRGVSLRSAGERAGDRAAKLLHRSSRGFVTLGTRHSKEESADRYSTISRGLYAPG